MVVIHVECYRCSWGQRLQILRHCVGALAFWTVHTDLVKKLRVGFGFLLLRCWRSVRPSSRCMFSLLVHHDELHKVS